MTTVEPHTETPTVEPQATTVEPHPETTTVERHPDTIGPRPEALEHLASAFKAAMAAVRRLRGRDTHRPGELSYAQYTLLFSLADRGGEASVRDLACAADLAPPSVTQMLDHLAADELVTRTRSELDKRVVLTKLTERGQALIAGRRARLEPRWRASLADFDDHELATAAAVLRRLATLFDEES